MPQPLPLLIRAWPQSHSKKQYIYVILYTIKGAMKCIILLLCLMCACMRYIRALELISMRNPFGTSYIIMNYYYAAIGESVDQ